LLNVKFVGASRKPLGFKRLGSNELEGVWTEGNVAQLKYCPGISWKG